MVAVTGTITDKIRKLTGTYRYPEEIYLLQIKREHFPVTYILEVDPEQYSELNPGQKITVKGRLINKKPLTLTEVWEIITL